MFKLSNCEINQVKLGNFLLSKREKYWALQLERQQWYFEDHGIPHLRTISECHFLIFKNYTRDDQSTIYILLDEWVRVNLKYLYDDAVGVYVIDQSCFRIRILTGYDRTGQIHSIDRKEVTFLKTLNDSWRVRYQTEGLCSVHQTGTGSDESRFCSGLQLHKFNNSFLVGTYFHCWIMSGDEADIFIAPYLIQEDGINYVMDDNQSWYKLPEYHYRLDYMTYWLGNYFFIDGRPYGVLNKTNTKWLDESQKKYITFMLFILNQCCLGTRRKLVEFIPKNILLEHILLHTLNFEPDGFPLL